MHQPHQPHRTERSHHRDVRHTHRHGPRQGPNDLPFGIREVLGRGRGGAPVRRGEIRPLILTTLLTKPMHGYEVIQELEAKTGGRWRPSAGSVYPTLQQLSDEGLVTSEDVDGRRTYTLTDDGRAAANAADARMPGSEVEEGGEPDIRTDAIQLAGAVMQVDRVGSAAARVEARRILTDARRQIYRLLAEDDEATSDSGPNPA